MKKSKHLRKEKSSNQILKSSSSISRERNNKKHHQAGKIPFHLGDGILSLTLFSLSDLVPTGDPETDARHRKRYASFNLIEQTIVLTSCDRLEEELKRMETTKQKKPRRKKTAVNAGSPGGNNNSPGLDGADPGTPAPGTGGKNTTATQRKCANCGQVGHIKTNKK